MWVSGQWFGSEVVERIAATVEADPSISRRALSRQVCEWLDWRSPDGRLRDVGCRKALLELQRRGSVKLPACEEVVGFGREAAKRSPPPAVPEVRCCLEELGEVEVVPVRSRYSQASRIWRDLLQAYHYLGAGPLCGAQMRYLVHSAAYGWLGALSFSAATWRLKSRDAWIGWSDRARRANLERVVCNSRFLIAPSVQVANLASHVLALSVGRLAQDWHARYGYAPVLVETFVDGARFAGTCYRAANWVRVGQTAGRRDGYGNGTVSTGKKDIYAYPLRADWQSRLCQEPPERLARRPAGGEAGHWAEEEFAGARVYDERLRKRLYLLAQDFFAQPGVLIPQACRGSVAKSKAAYRFFDNERVDMPSLLKGHVEATAQRVSQHAVVLAVQDTTTLNYTAHPATAGLGPINTKKDQGVGLILHDTLAFSGAGTPLGLVDVQCWARDPEQAGTKRAKRNHLPIEAKESFKWLQSYRAAAEVQRLCPQTLVVSVGDREADLHELFQEAQQTAAGPKLLVRAERTRQRQVEAPAAPDADEPEYLWARMAAAPVAGHQEVHIPREGARLARTATLEVRYAAVTLKPPQRKPLGGVAAWAVYAREVDGPPAVTAPLEWMLLTTVEVATFAQATERLRWYTLRWGIEVYHRVLKSGCRIEDRQLSSATRIENCLALDLVVAWRIFWLTKQARETPDVPCDGFLGEDEWKALYATGRDAPLPPTPPPLREAVRLIASLGGFLGRPRDGEPGTTTVWRGLVRLDTMVIGYRAALRLAAARDGP
jgi:hypothetical protein